MAAGLVGYRASAFVRFMSKLRTRYIGNHGRFVSMSQTSGNTASNWGAWSLASRIAIDVFVRDRRDLARAARIFRGFLGNRHAYAGFKRTMDFDASYVCGSARAWRPINPAGCGDKSGAIVEDISRSSRRWPHVDDVGRTYSWETLGGATLSARVLFHHGYPGVYGWSNRALLRAARFQQRHGGYRPLYTTNQYVPWSINKAYHIKLGPVSSLAGFGRQDGYTDWLL